MTPELSAHPLGFLHPLLAIGDICRASQLADLGRQSPRGGGGD